MRRLLLAGALIAALVVPTSAFAVGGPYKPKGEFSVFDDCPLSKSTLFLCVFSESSKGSFTLGKKTVPIVNPVVLQGGLDQPKSQQEEEEGAAPFVAAEDGNTLVKTPQPVPGGLLGITAPSWWPQILKDLFNNTINEGFTGVTATVELAAPASSLKLNSANLLNGTGIALSMPAKVKLSNPFLGSNCYIGSNSKPIVFDFTTGTTAPPPPNKPITGDPGEVVFGAESVITFTGGRLVNNSFAAPGANGCGGILFSWLVDPFVNSIVGLPAAGGTNTAILEGKIQVASPEGVKASI